MTSNPDFEPNDPQIQVFLRNDRSVTNAAAAAAAADPDAAPTSLAADDESPDPDGKAEDASAQTVEYDVFQCDAYDEDMGKWVRLMPDADFVPT